MSWSGHSSGQALSPAILGVPVDTGEDVPGCWLRAGPTQGLSPPVRAGASCPSSHTSELSDPGSQGPQGTEHPPWDHILNNCCTDSALTLALGGPAPTRAIQRPVCPAWTPGSGPCVLDVCFSEHWVSGHVRKETHV